MNEKCNNLSGKEWLRYSISVWSDIYKNGSDKVTHPAVFPCALVERILKCYTNSPLTILDPFAGSGTVLYVGNLMGHKTIGFEVYEHFINQIKERIGLFNQNCKIIHDSVENAPLYLQENTIDMIITSPPYWNILKKKRTADRKKEKFYGDSLHDIGNIEKYTDYVKKLVNIFIKLKPYLKDKAILFINVMDLREKSKFYPLHVDLINGLKEQYELEDIIIWDRRQEYNNLKPLGYPYKFVINRVHEYILIFRNRL
ncbi:MAG: DNA methyltransferase [Candidatus Aenigmatarchaeota archaeon]